MQTNQTDKATARPLTFKASNKNTGAFYRKSTGDFSSNFESATELDAQQLAVVRATFDNVVAHSVIPSDRADISKTEHAAYQETVRALLAVLPYGNEALQIKAEKLLRGEL